jgi:hypothetical protein
LQVFDDLLRDDIGRREIGAIFDGFVFHRKDVGVFVSKARTESPKLCTVLNRYLETPEVGGDSVEVAVWSGSYSIRKRPSG